MKSLVSFLICIIFIIPAFCQQGDNVVIAKTGADRMRDIDGVRVVVEKFADQYKEKGFDETNVNKFAVSKLKENTCFDETSDSYVYININPIMIDDTTLAASVHISLNRPVYYPAENKTFISMATVWQSGSIITFPSDSTDYIYDILGKLMDKYIIEWYKSRIPYKEETELNNQKELPAKEEEKKNEGNNKMELRHKSDVIA